MLSINEREFMLEQRFRPTTLDECILPAVDQQIFKAIIKNKRIPHLILHSPSPGTGKTTIARVLCNETNAEMLFVNGSDCKIDFVRGELTRFASSKSMDGKHKVIIIDEFDRPGLVESQRHLRSFMEAYSANCSVIITANNVQGIIKPLHSRCRVIEFGRPTQEDSVLMKRAMIKRAAEICKAQNIKVEDVKILAALVTQNFPDFRKTINELDRYSGNGVIDAGILSVVTQDRGSIDEVIAALKSKDFKTLKTLIPKYSADYPWFVEKLADTLLPLVSSQSVIEMYEIIGENNQFHSMAASIDVHMMHMLLRLIVSMVWL
ncbi:clamp loader of DNA polymerase [Pseudomonas phage PspYZU05]|uniref:Sliding-clamp-loader large subunit n=1 Tax=Pseudomonas phage PspYZU05 TaxID=1983556 RepID=A0A2U7NLU0_9CAUD|nr:clamp loader of DNA polymerase [Pseudomonas phage PspYZU05]ASD52038.1 hypothetical protein PspYZU05_86 [Pseudomonas phage PspYZU05]